jgi:hypothetical protein
MLFFHATIRHGLDCGHYIFNKKTMAIVLFVLQYAHCKRIQISECF